MSPATQMGGTPPAGRALIVGRRHRVVLAVVAERLRRERGMEHVEELFEHRARLRDVDAEPFELVGLIARTDAEHEPSAGETVDHPDLGEHPGGLVERRDDDRGREADPFRYRGAVRGHDEGRGADAVVREVMLREPCDREPRRIGLAHLLDVLVEDPARRRAALAVSHQSRSIRSPFARSRRGSSARCRRVRSGPRRLRHIDGLPLYGRGARMRRCGIRGRGRAPGRRSPPRRRPQPGTGSPRRRAVPRAGTSRAARCP